MAETKITAKLPNLDMEITRRELAEENAETITLRMTAVPSFDAVAGLLTQPPALPAIAWMGLWVDAWQPWAHLAQSVWMPWLQPMMSRLERKSDDCENG